MVDYSLTEYTGAFQKIKIMCNEHKIVFEIIAGNHLIHKESCPICRSRNLRLRRIKKISENKLNGHPLMPVFNKKACELFDNISKEKNIFIQHALNGGEFHIKELGYWVDGFDLNNNTVYEYYEKHHYKKGELKEKEKKREKEICDFLGCKFISIKG